MNKPLLLALLVASTILLSGCTVKKTGGGDDGSGDTGGQQPVPGSPGDVVKAFILASDRGDTTGAKSYVAADVQDDYYSYPARFTATSEYASYSSFSLVQEKLSGDRAVVRYRLDSGAITYEAQLRKEGGNWKVSARVQIVDASSPIGEPGVTPAADVAKAFAENYIGGHPEAAAALVIESKRAAMQSEIEAWATSYNIKLGAVSIITDEQVSGDAATIELNAGTYEMEVPYHFIISLVKEDSEWRVDSFSETNHPGIGD